MVLYTPETIDARDGAQDLGPNGGRVWTQEESRNGNSIARHEHVNPPKREPRGQ
jgi:hypothetical protein